jgi:hypothetical protein
MYWDCNTSFWNPTNSRIIIFQFNRTFYAALTWSCDHASPVLRHHIGVTTLERPPDPTGLSTFRGDSNSWLPDLELGALTNWLACRMLVWVSRQSYLLRSPDSDQTHIRVMPLSYLSLRLFVRGGLHPWTPLWVGQHAEEFRQISHLSKNSVRKICKH